MGRTSAAGIVISLGIALTARMALAGGGQCRGDFNGDSRVTIDEIVTAIGESLDGCGDPAPTARPTATQIPSLAGTYVVDQVSLTESNCDARIRAGIEDVVRTLLEGCTFELTTMGTQATLESCSGEVFRGTVTSAGVVQASASASQVANGCGLTTRITLRVNATMNPSTATFTGNFDFGAECVFTDTQQHVRDCSATAQARWQRR